MRIPIALPVCVVLAQVLVKFCNLLLFFLRTLLMSLRFDIFLGSLSIVDYILLIIINSSVIIYQCYISSMSTRTSPYPRSPALLRPSLSSYFLSSDQPQQIPKPQQRSISKKEQKSKPKSMAKFSSQKQTRNRSPTTKNQKDITGHKLAQQLKQHGEKLLKKLHVHTMLYNIEHINKCIKHDCYLSAFDVNNNKLLCAVCYTDIKAKNHNFLSHSPSKSTTPKPNIIPLQKANQLLQTQTLSTKYSIENQLVVMKQIEDILYQGFQEERQELNTKLKIIDDKYGQAMEKLKDLQMSAKENVMRKYQQERNKHEAVIKELGVLRSLVEDYLAPKELETRANTTDLLSNLSNQFYVSTRKSRLQKSPSLNSNSPSRSLNKFPSTSALKIIEPPPLKQSIFKHLIYHELSQSLKFGKSGFMWSKQKHRNSIKQLTDDIIKQIDKIANTIPTPCRLHKNL